MTFKEIFQHDGLYVADGFAEGYCFEIDNGTLSGMQFEHKDDIFPMRYAVIIYKGLFDKEYKTVLTRQSLFKTQ